MSCEYEKKIRERIQLLLKEHNLGDLPAPQSVSYVRKVWCYPIQFAIACPRLPIVDYLADRNQVTLRYHNEPLVINAIFLQKLVNFLIILLYKYLVAQIGISIGLLKVLITLIHTSFPPR